MYNIAFSQFKMNLKNKKKLALIVPPVVTHNLDPHTGIPFLPHMAGYLAAKILDLGHDLNVVDCFGINSKLSRKFNDFLLIGIDEEEVITRIGKNLDICFIYCKVIEDLYAVEKLVKILKIKLPNIKICLFENIQTTNSFSLRKISDYLFSRGCDYILLGEPEHKIENFLESYNDIQKLKKVPGIAYKIEKNVFINDNEEFNKNLDEIPFPAWHKFNMEGYWEAGYSHAPVKKNSKFLPIISSRGCPYRCKFCVSPTLNPTWRPRSAKNVVDEIEHLNKTLNVTDFHFSDLDPTVNEKRTVQISNEIIKRNLKIEWKLSQGTKVETIKNLSTLDIMKKSGLSFFSFSPESGSIELMKKLNKPFDYDHGLKIVKYLHKLEINSQACFIAGTPPETKLDRKKSLDYMKKLAKAGVDEIAVFIYSPIPGSYFADQIGGFKHYSELSRSPKWRNDYKEVSIFRYKMYTIFVLYKFIFHPIKLIKNIRAILSRNFKSKMEMSIFKYLKLRYLKYRKILANADN